MTDFYLIITFEKKNKFQGVITKTSKEKTAAQFYEKLLGSEICKAVQKHPKGSSGISIIWDI